MKLTERQREVLEAMRYSGHTWHAPADLPQPALTILYALERKQLVWRRESKVNGRKVWAVTSEGKTLMTQLRPDPISRQLAHTADLAALLHDAGAF